MPGAPASQGFTRLSKVLAAVLVAGYTVVYVYPPALDFLSLTPGRTLPLVWNLFTAGLVHKSVLLLVFNLVAVIFLSRVVEPYYGSREYLKFLSLVNLITGLATFISFFLLFIATQRGKVLYVKMAGFHGVTAGLLVAVKQVMPHHEFKLFGLLGFRAQYLPSLFLLLAIPAAVLTNNVYDVMFLVYGTYFAWLYLRFFQQQPDLPFTGDASDDFKFSSFFPPFLSTPIDSIAALFSVVFRLKHSDSSESAKLVSLPTTSSVGPDASETNRRRERGAKALEERLKKGSDVEQGSPSGKAEQ